MRHDPGIKDEINYRLAAQYDPASLCERLGKDCKRKGNVAWACCPWHSERTASWKLAKHPRDGLFFAKCFGCGVAGDVFHVIASSYGLDTRSDFPEILELAADLAGYDLRRSPPPPPRPRLPPAPPKTFPPASEVAEVWEACVPVVDIQPAKEWLHSRRISPRAITDRDVARAIGPHTSLPAWARMGERDWRATGHHLLMPVFDATGAMVSLRAVLTCSSNLPKRLSPQGHYMGAAVMANRAALEILAGVCADVLVVAEGEPDTLTWASAPGEPAVMGLYAAAWSQAIADAIAGCVSHLVLRVHHDGAGDRYAADVARSLAGSRVEVFRSAADPVGDENDQHQARKLKPDPTFGAMPWAPPAEENP